MFNYLSCIYTGTVLDVYRNIISNAANRILPLIEGFDVDLGVVSSRCGVDKESAVADGAVVEALSFHRLENVVSVMFVLACSWEFWVCYACCCC